MKLFCSLGFKKAKVTNFKRRRMFFPKPLSLDTGGDEPLTKEGPCDSETALLVFFFFFNAFNLNFLNKTHPEIKT